VFLRASLDRVNVVIKLIGPADLPHIPQLVNKSSKDHSFAFDINLGSFLALSSYWDFSYQHSYIAYIGNEAVGVLLSVVDTAARESYSFYWGVLPQYRGTPLALRMGFKFLRQAVREGFLYSHADVASDSPLTIYHRLGYRKVAEIDYMASDGPLKYEVLPSNSVQLEWLPADQFLDKTHSVHEPAISWAQRPEALRRAARVLQFVRHGTAYAAIERQSHMTRVMRFHFRPDDVHSAAGLLARLKHPPFPVPLHVCHVLPGSELRTLLTDLGFANARKGQALRLDLKAWAAGLRALAAGG
jgi:hypothetical protein